MNITELKEPDSDCKYCNGTGEADSGGTHPWGAPATIPCRCMYEDPFHVHVSAYNNIAAQLEDAQGEIRALRATEAGLVERVKELEDGLEKICAIEHQMNGLDWEEIEEAQSIARALLEKKE